jgi:hypothetical protein
MSLTIDFSSGDWQVADSSVGVVEAKEVTYRTLPASSRTVIDLGKVTRIKLRPVIPGSPLDKVLKHVGMRAMQQVVTGSLRDETFEEEKTIHPGEDLGRKIRN